MGPGTCNPFERETEMSRKTLIVSLLLASVAFSGTVAAEEGGGIGSAIERGATATGNGIERGANAAVRGTEKGVKAAAGGIERGAKATVRGVERGANATADALERLSRKIGGE